jgi:peroxiredoxin
MNTIKLRFFPIGLALILIALMLRTGRAADDSTLTKVGDKSPVASVRTIDGKEVKLEGQVVVLNFFATWCGPCMSEMPHLQKELWEPLEKKGLILIAVGREHTEAEVKAFKDKKGLTFAFVADPKREVFGKFATQSIPRCVLIGKDGHIKYQSIGFEVAEFGKLVDGVKQELDKPKDSAAAKQPAP